MRRGGNGVDAPAGHPRQSRHAACIRSAPLWAAAFDEGVHCYDPDGRLIGRLLVPEPVSNLAFGGSKNNRLFLTATTSFYSLVMAVTGTPRVRRGRV